MLEETFVPLFPWLASAAHPFATHESPQTPQNLALWVEFSGRLLTLERENEELRRCVGAQERGVLPKTIVSAKPVFLGTFVQGNAPFSIDVGTRHAVGKDQLVLSSKGFVLGRVGSVSENAAQVIPLAYTGQKWSVYTEHSHESLVLRGDRGVLTCLLRKTGVPLTPNECIFTEWNGVSFPLAKVGPDGVTFEPLVSWPTVSLVHVVAENL